MTKQEREDQMELHRSIIDTRVESRPIDASILLRHIHRQTYCGGACPFVDAEMCAQQIIPTDLKAVSRLGLLAFGIWQAADAIFMLADMRYHKHTGRILKDEERMLFADDGLVRYFIEQHAATFGYHMEDLGEITGTNSKQFRLTCVEPLSMQQLQIKALEYPTGVIAHGKFSPELDVIADSLWELIARLDTTEMKNDEHERLLHHGTATH